MFWKFFREPFNLAVVAAGLALYYLSHRFDAFDAFYDATRAYELYELDELANVVFIAGVLAPVILIRFNNQLRKALHKRAEAEAEASRIALHDPLTGLHNRRYLNVAISELGKDGWATEENVGMTVLLIDLDRFKPINDLRGHHAGDQLLRAVSERLQGLCSEEDELMRMGGDEFAILVRSSDQRAAATMAQKTLNAIARPFDFGGWTAHISCSIGLAKWQEGLTGSELLRHADQAMYKAKANGRDNIVHYDQELGEQLRETAQLQADLKDAVEQAAIVPYFQPIYDIRTGEIRAFEVLARWRHDTRGFVPPDLFIPLAEDLGLIDRLSETLLDESVRELLDWPTEAGLSFNISPTQFSNSDLARRIATILRRHRFPGRRLEIEITERAVLRDINQARNVIAELAAMGVKIALDDFGTGTSSLSTLTQLPISRIKIDRSFVTDIATASQNSKIVSGVLALAQSLSLNVTAEGIEHEEELIFLREHDCDCGQGYYLCRPVPASEILKLFDVPKAQAAAG
ncbi:putative bifunctional diguanylate cyclase/phosphodiesterase [Pseudoroseicyclus tamaricis]|uniref:EAL domain-containing protein n=1 Tax=Pseudoroseicyclus tamaricis TaxID=2705421 RepID=A0A6B2JTP4_9RHOB|nr:EAL domain-containing protein [Pseudoroseicyclus tamaricis]NDV01420.1 EAL domain-containing protein [Pseudoroseicyclus tamaricis]